MTAHAKYCCRLVLYRIRNNSTSKRRKDGTMHCWWCMRLLLISRCWPVTWAKPRERCQDLQISFDKNEHADLWGTRLATVPDHSTNRNPTFLLSHGKSVDCRLDLTLRYLKSKWLQSATLPVSIWGNCSIRRTFIPELASKGVSNNEQVENDGDWTFWNEWNVRNV